MYEDSLNVDKRHSSPVPSDRPSGDSQSKGSEAHLGGSDGLGAVLQ